MINPNSHQNMPAEGVPEGTLEGWAVQKLKRWQAPTPTLRQRAKLLEVLMAEMPSKRESQVERFKGGGLLVALAAPAWTDACGTGRAQRKYLAQSSSPPPIYPLYEHDGGH